MQAAVVVMLVLSYFARCQVVRLSEESDFSLGC